MGLANSPRYELFRARAMSLCLVGHRPIRSRGGYANGRGLNAYFTFRCPRFPGLALGPLMSTNQ
jgi:hypothetical protein